MSLIALGVTGGIGAYKAVEVARGLQKNGHDVAAVMTHNATKFVGELTFEAITRRRVITDQYAPGLNADIEHISLATEIALLLVAPATANIIGKFAHGIADDFLSSMFLATRAPVLIAPAMNTNMLEHESVQANIRTLASRGVRFVDPGQGYLACGWVGKGRLAEPDEIVAAAEQVLRGSRTLEGRVVVVSAGPTYEDIDAVRYVGNRSSGKMGYAIAAEAARRGARVVLVSGPTRLPAPVNAELVGVRSARQMCAAMREHCRRADLIVMAAAVADYTPASMADGKIEKTDGPMTLELVRALDILAELGARRRELGNPVLIGFAAEDRDPVARAREKLLRKHADMIVANDISRTDAGFDADTNAVTLVTATGADAVPLASKATIAAAILDRAEALLRLRAAP